MTLWSIMMERRARGRVMIPLWAEKNEVVDVTGGGRCPHVMSGETNNTQTHTRRASRQMHLRADLRLHNHMKRS